MATNNSSIAKLGDDVLAEILTRLPGPRSAFRSKAVCKRWNAFISTPCFSRRFVAHHRQIGSAAEPEPESEPEPPLPNPYNLRESILTFLPLPIAGLSRFTVLDCFNDLLLLGFRSSDANDELERTFLLCNPFTKQWIALPLAAQSRPRSPGTTVSFARLVCSSNGEETSFTITQRFGYRFRVVRMCKNTAQHSATCSILDVFCSESGEWTKVALDLHGGQFGPHVDLLHFAVPLNGKLYWMNGLNQVVEWNPFRPYDQMRSSSSTDVIEIGRPFLFSYSRDSFLISSSQGVLHIVLGAFSRFREVLIVWRLEEEGGGFWKKLYEVSLEKLMHSTRCNASEYALQFEVCDVVGHHQQKSEIVFLRCNHTSSRRFYIFSCNLRTEEAEFLFYHNELLCDLTMLHQPKVHLWTTRICSERSLCAHNGSYCFWFEPSNQ